MNTNEGSWLARTGVLVLVLGPIPALFGALNLVAIPVLGIVAHVAMMMTGVLFMCVGLAWPEKGLRPGHQRAAVWLLVGGAYGAIAAVIIAALLGIGGEALAAVPGGIIGTPLAESSLQLVLYFSGLSVAAALSLILGGSFERTSGEERTRVPVGVRLVQTGMAVFLIGVLSAVATGITGAPGLGMPTHVGVVIAGLVLMAFGHVLPVVGLGEKAERWVAGLLMVGAIGVVVTGGLAARFADRDSVLDSFFSGFIGSGFDPVQLVALLTVLAAAFGAMMVWHGLPGEGPGRKGALIPIKDPSLRVIRLGVVLVVFSLVAGFLTGLTRVPRVAVGTWGTTLIIGPMLMCFGLLWRGARERMTESRQRLAHGFLAYGAFGLLISGMVLALLGIGGDTLGFSAANRLGSESQELLAKIAVDGSALLLVIGIVLVWRGTRVRAATSVFGRAERIAYYVLFLLIMQTAFFHVLPKLYFPDSYPVRIMEYDLGGQDAPAVSWIDSTGTTFYPAEADARGQGLTRDDWLWFYHAPQGGAFELPIPYDWMMALERPTVAFWPASEVGPLMDSDYLAGFGFLPNHVTSYRECNVSVKLGRVARLLDTREEGVPDPCESPEGGGPEPENNPDGLPVGFAKVENWIDHATGQTIDAMGFTCAACHTGQLDYISPSDSTLHRIRIEGGGGNVDLGKFRIAVAQSLFLTKVLPRRFERFASNLDRIRAARSGEGASATDRVRLEADLDALLERGENLREVQKTMYPTTEGYARLDAIGRITNYVFSNDLQMEENLEVADAPVNFPYIWDAPKLEWVQYNASFGQPMMRNAGQSMGVFASVDLRGSGPSVEADEDALLFSSSIDILNIHEMETLLSGCPEVEPNGLERRCRDDFAGLESPRWPSDVFGKLDTLKVKAGRELYKELCSSCHGQSPDAVDVFWETTANWNERSRVDTLPSDTVRRFDQRYIRVPVEELWRIGTDPMAAVNFRQREARMGELGDRLGMGPERDAPTLSESLTRLAEGQPVGAEEDSTVSGAEALVTLIERVKTRRYEELGMELPDTSIITPRDARPDTIALLRAELDGYRENDIQAPLGYRARPLNGVWATPPFLHNASVPTLYHLLGPQEERPERFYLGSRIFDPGQVGFRYSEEPGAFEFDTSLRGNSNQGHSFEGDGTALGKRGVIGRFLRPEERLQIIEYLKWLPPLPPPPDA